MSLFDSLCDEPSNAFYKSYDISEHAAVSEVIMIFGVRIISVGNSL
jgi:hypothetical protein